MVDDHSTDDTRHIIQSWAAQNDQMKFISNPGKGIIDALRSAYSISKGSLITRMDADDIMTANKLKIMALQLIDNGPRHIATGKVKYFRNDQALGKGYKQYANWLNALSQKGNNFDEIYKECVIASPCWMIYREDLDAIGAFTPDLYPEDYDLVFRMYAYGLKIIPCADEILHLWRDHSERASRNDENYQDNSFLSLKLRYFIQLDLDQNKVLLLWGAGSKAKTIAKSLLNQNIDFDWITDNPKKIGHNIYGKILQSTLEIPVNESIQIILSMANPQEQLNIKERISKLSIGTDCQSFWFC